ncbi:MAG TPA: hypothetical protein VFJ91_00935 [Gaiellaceae bacterium]|nr:hypothetical protein [Gaiellaceae bacterium]
MKRVALTALVLAALLVAAVGASTATGARHKPKQSKQVVTLKKQVAKLKKENAGLQQYTPAAIKVQLAKAKAALDKYQDVKVAEADGYAPASPCESTPTDPDQTSYGGGMGVHFVNGAIMQSGAIDPTKPPILTYLPKADGTYELLAAEWFKPDADQNAATDGDRPTLFGRAFDGPMAGHAPGMPMHFDLHVWLWKHNPTGLFSSWNPDVTCPAG